MRKYIYTLIGIAAALSAFSCSQVLEEDINTTEDPQTQPVKEYVLASNIPATITADFVQTKTDYESDGKFSWKVSDEVQLYFVDDIDTPANQGWVAYYIAGAGDIVGKKATFTIKAGQEGKTNAESGALKDYKNTGLAVYGRGAVNTVARPYSANTEPCSDLGGKFISLQQKLTGGASEVILLGTESEGVFSFRTAAAVLKVTVTGIPANASKLKLCTANNESSPLDGDFLFDNTRELQKGDYRKYSGGAYNSSHEYVYVDLSGEGAIASRDFYFNIPTGSYDANTISLVLEDGSGNELLKKTITSAFTFNRNDLVSVSFANEWVTLGTGKFRDAFYLGEIKLDAWDWASVDIQRNVSNPNQYRVVNPYKAYSTANNYTQPTASSDYLVFTVDPSTDYVTFERCYTGIRYTYDFLISQTDKNGGKTYYVDGHNIVVSKDGSGNPLCVQLAPYYLYTTLADGYSRTDKDGLIMILFPDYDTSFDIYSDNGPTETTVNVKATSTNVAYVKAAAASTESAAKSAIKVTDYKLLAGTTRISSGVDVEVPSTTGRYYLAIKAYDASGREINRMTKYVYHITGEDQTALVGSYINSSNSDRPVTVSASTDALHGNLKISAYSVWSLTGNIYGYYDGSESVIFDSTIPFNQHANGKYYCIFGPYPSVGDVTFSVSDKGDNTVFTVSSNYFGIGEATISDGIVVSYIYTSHFWSKDAVFTKQP